MGSGQHRACIQGTTARAAAAMSALAALGGAPGRPSAADPALARLIVNTIVASALESGDQSHSDDPGHDGSLPLGS
jgi:hypothetical protein